MRMNEYRMTRRVLKVDVSGGDQGYVGGMA